MRLTAGDRVTVRGERWVVEDATTFPDATVLTLASTERPDAQHACRVLIPFDRPTLFDPVPRVRAVTTRRWTCHLRAHLGGQRVHGQLRAARRAAINILPFQLEPALALIQGRASRFLLADEVGLGKTIQAGLMLAELRHRGWCDRALIMTPPGLRGQWADELQHRFDIRSAVIDATSLSMLARSLPYDVNPWTVEPVVITSIDFIKQPEVLHAVTAHPWDLVIVDEAHQATLASQRYDAVQNVAARARHVVLVTATPHAGDERAYRALCGLGQLDGSEPILLFRRTREQAGLPRRRRAHLLRVRPSPAAVEMHRQLDTYLAQLWAISHTAGKHDARLVAMVLAKRAFSSAGSLARSLERRMAALEGNTDWPAEPSLPFDSDADDSDQPQMPNTPAFDRAEDERAVLKRLIDCARYAQADERKLRALCRILGRIDEPAIVFTEYRDTLEAIAAAVGALRRITMLHGGQTPQERRDSIAFFTDGAADLLLATDAGSEGLNLQRRCRLVINLELPWNPIRLEQRIGRVDRIGQTHTVHAINLLAAGTAEGDVLAGLLRRLDCIRMSEIELAACVINRSEPLARRVTEGTSTMTADVREAAEREALRVARVRGIEAGRDVVCESLVPATVIKPRPGSPAHALRRHLIAFMRVRLVTEGGRLIEDTLVPIGVRLNETGRRLTRREVRATAEALLATVHPDLVRVAREHARARANAVALESTGWIARAIERERHVVKCAAARGPSLVQAGLFDRRTLKLHSNRRQHSDAIQHDSVSRTNRLEADSRVSLAQDPEIALLLIAAC